MLAHQWSSFQLLADISWPTSQAQPSGMSMHAIRSDFTRLPIVVSVRQYFCPSECNRRSQRKQHNQNSQFCHNVWLCSELVPLTSYATGDDHAHWEPMIRLQELAIVHVGYQDVVGDVHGCA